VGGWVGGWVSVVVWVSVLMCVQLDSQCLSDCARSLERRNIDQGSTKALASMLAEGSSLKALRRLYEASSLYQLSTKPQGSSL
jgi:hypothetical protein